MECGSSWGLGPGEDMLGRILPQDDRMSPGQDMGKVFHHNRAAGTKTWSHEVSRPEQMNAWGCSMAGSKAACQEKAGRGGPEASGGCHSIMESQHLLKCSEEF